MVSLAGKKHHGREFRSGNLEAAKEKGPQNPL